MRPIYRASSFADELSQPQGTRPDVAIFRQSYATHKHSKIRRGYQRHLRFTCTTPQPVPTGSMRMEKSVTSLESTYRFGVAFFTASHAHFDAVDRCNDNRFYDPQIVDVWIAKACDILQQSSCVRHYSDPCCPTTRSPDRSHFLASQLLKEPDDALNPTIEVGDVEFFVGRVQVVVRQAKAHHHAREFSAHPGSR